MEYVSGDNAKIDPAVSVLLEISVERSELESGGTIEGQWRPVIISSFSMVLVMSLELHPSA